jgi:hypothetical protein
MRRLRYRLAGLFATIGLIAGVGSSELLEPGPAQAKQEGSMTLR